MSMAVKKAMVQGRARGEMPSMSRPTTTGMKASPMVGVLLLEHEYKQQHAREKKHKNTKKKHYKSGKKHKIVLGLKHKNKQNYKHKRNYKQNYKHKH